jgi:ATP-dependent exoDNAse (exonuclease V) alpha subunit
VVLAADGLVNGRTGVVQHIEVSKHSGKRPLCHSHQQLVWDQQLCAGKIPVIRFSNGTTAAIQPETWNITRNGTVVATRTQLPLDLAWAFSVHKSQVLRASLLQFLNLLALPPFQPPCINGIY